MALFAEEQFAQPVADIECRYRQTPSLDTFGGNATSPRSARRACAAPKLGVPRLLRHFYQAPPLLTASAGGSIRERPKSQLHSVARERDEESHSESQSAARNARGCGYVQDARKKYFDHSNVGNSDIFFPLTIDEHVS